MKMSKEEMDKIANSLRIAYREKMLKAEEEGLVPEANFRELFSDDDKVGQFKEKYY